MLIIRKESGTEDFFHREVCIFLQKFVSNDLLGRKEMMV